MIEFKIHKAEEVPPLDDMSLQISAWFFGKTKTLGNEIKKSLVAWDFKNAKWIFSRAGHIELIEYYIEND